MGSESAGRPATSIEERCTKGMGNEVERGGCRVDSGVGMEVNWKCPNCGGQLEVPGRCVDCGVMVKIEPMRPGQLERMVADIVRRLTNNEED